MADEGYRGEVAWPDWPGKRVHRVERVGPIGAGKLADLPVKRERGRGRVREMGGERETASTQCKSITGWNTLVLGLRSVNTCTLPMCLRSATWGSSREQPQWCGMLSAGSPACLKVLAYFGILVLREQTRVVWCYLFRLPRFSVCTSSGCAPIKGV